MKHETCAQVPQVEANLARIAGGGRAPQLRHMAGWVRAQCSAYAAEGGAQQ